MFHPHTHTHTHTLTSPSHQVVNLVVTCITWYIHPHSRLSRAHLDTLFNPFHLPAPLSDHLHLQLSSFVLPLHFSFYFTSFATSRGSNAAGESKCLQVVSPHSCCLFKLFSRLFLDDTQSTLEHSYTYTHIHRQGEEKGLWTARPLTGAFVSPSYLTSSIVCKVTHTLKARITQLRVASCQSPVTSCQLPCSNRVALGSTLLIVCNNQYWARDEACGKRESYISSQIRFSSLTLSCTRLELACTRTTGGRIQCSFSLFSFYSLVHSRFELDAVAVLPLVNPIDLKE